MINNRINDGNNCLHKQNKIQKIKKNQINLSNFDPIKYKRALLNLQSPIKYLQNKKNKNGHIKKNTFNSFGPYNRYTDEGGGFCQKLNNKDKNIGLIYEFLPKNIPKYKQYTDRYCKNKININTYSNNNKNGNTKALINKENIFIQENDIDDKKENKINYGKNNNNNKNNEIIHNINNNFKNYRRNSFDKKLNLKDVNNSIKYLQLDPNQKHNSLQSTKESSIKNKKDKNISNKKGQNKKTNKKFFEEIDNDYQKKIKKLELNSIQTQTPPYEKLNYTERILVKDTIEQFSMKKNDIKKFINLTEGDSVLLEFSPIKKDKYIDYAIYSNRIEFQRNIKTNKINPENKNKLIIKVNELEILPKNSKIKNDEKDSINKLESNKKNGKDIMAKTKKFINKEINKENNTDIIINKKDEIKDIQNINNKIEIKEDKTSSKGVNKLSKYKERIKRKNEINEKEKVNTRNKIKNLALELEKQMFKNEKENEDEIDKKAQNDKIELKVEENNN